MIKRSKYGIAAVALNIPDTSVTVKTEVLCVRFGNGCAWRAIYLYAFGRQVFRLGIDPTFYGNRARVFAGIGIERRFFGRWVPYWSCHFDLWRSRHWWKLDGRYGTWRRVKP